jgi:hypothetical protein
VLKMETIGLEYARDQRRLTDIQVLGDKIVVIVDKSVI